MRKLTKKILSRSLTFGSNISDSISSSLGLTKSASKVFGGAFDLFVGFSVVSFAASCIFPAIIYGAGALATGSLSTLGLFGGATAPVALAVMGASVVVGSICVASVAIGVVAGAVGLGLFSGLYNKFGIIDSSKVTDVSNANFSNIKKETVKPSTLIGKNISKDFSLSVKRNKTKNDNSSVKNKGFTANNRKLK